MELKTYLTIIWRRKWTILMSAGILILLALIVLSMLPNKYAATSRLRFLTPKSGGANYIDFNIYYASRIMNTYTSLASSSSIAQEIKNKLKLSQTPKIEASVVADSELIKITSEENDPNLSASIANTAAEILVDRSKSSALDAQSSAENAINTRIERVNKELIDARDTYMKLSIPYEQNNNRITELNSQILTDQQLYIALKTVYEQNVQLVKRDEIALSKLENQIIELENRITLNKETISLLSQQAIHDSAQLDSTQDDIELKQQEYANLVDQLDQIQSLVIIQGGNQLTFEEKAFPALIPSSPNRLLLSLLAILFSFFVSIIAGFILDNVDDSFQNILQIETTVDGKFLGNVFFARNPIQSFINPMQSKHVIETNHTYMNLHRHIQKKKLKTIVFCGAVPEMSNSPFLTRLSIEYANSGMKVLLIDANMLAPGLYRFFPKLKAKAGLSQYLNSELPVDEIINPTNIANLSIIPPGPKTPSNGLLLSSKKMLVLLSTLKNEFDLVFIEISPFTTEGDIDELICHVDGVVEVINQGRSKMKNVLSVAKHLLELNTPLVGYIVTHP